MAFILCVEHDFSWIEFTVAVIRITFNRPPNQIGDDLYLRVIDYFYFPVAKNTFASYLWNNLCLLLLRSKCAVGTLNFCLIWKKCLFQRRKNTDIARYKVIII